MAGEVGQSQTSQTRAASRAQDISRDDEAHLTFLSVPGWTRALSDQNIFHLASVGEMRGGHIRLS